MLINTSPNAIREPCFPIQSSCALLRCFQKRCWSKYLHAFGNGYFFRGGYLSSRCLRDDIDLLVGISIQGELIPPQKHNTGTHQYYSVVSIDTLTANHIATQQLHSIQKQATPNYKQNFNRLGTRNIIIKLQNNDFFNRCWRIGIYTGDDSQVTFQ